MSDNTQDLDGILNSGEGVLHCCGDYQEQAKQALLDWHNKQIEAVLDRFNIDWRNELSPSQKVAWDRFIEAERNKLKESK